MWNAAITGLVGMSAAGFLIADGETRRVRWIQAMRKCLLRLSERIRYDGNGLEELLRGVELRSTAQERALTAMLQASAEAMARQERPELRRAFLCVAARTREYGVLSGDDRRPFEEMLGELGRTGLREQLRLIDETDERLRAIEETLRRESARRAQLIRTLGVACGAACFLLFV